MGIRPSFRFFYNINRELSNSKENFSFFTTQQREKKRNSVYIIEYILFLIFLVLIFDFESASCVETSGAGLLVP